MKHYLKVIFLLFISITSVAYAVVSAQIEANDNLTVIDQV